MANLIIQENGVARTTPAVHGEEITIQTPCDCSAVSGVQIAGVAYPFYDAAGKALPAGTGLFTEGSLIRVLIDTVNTRATIINHAITPDAIGAAKSSHNHSASNITSGTLPVSRGGTGNTSVDTTPTSGSTKMVTSGGVYTALSKKADSDHGNHVPATETANNAKFLRNDNTWQTVTPANIGAVPTSRTVNGKALSGNITLGASDVGADASGTASSAVSSHNSSSTAHADIRELIANKKGAVTYTATIGTSWTENEDTGVKSQNVAISGVTASQTAKVDHRYNGNGTSDGYATFVNEENQYLEFITNGYAETYNGGITFYIFGDAPTISIPIVVEVA